jgi:hypothetical protein
MRNMQSRLFLLAALVFALAGICIGDTVYAQLFNDANCLQATCSSYVGADPVCGTSEPHFMACTSSEVGSFCYCQSQKSSKCTADQIGIGFKNCKGTCNSDPMKDCAFDRYYCAQPGNCP